MWRIWLRIKIFFAVAVQRAPRAFGIKIDKFKHPNAKGIIIPKFLAKKYDIESLTIPAVKKRADNKIIWQFWDSGTDNAPGLVKTCLASVAKHRGDWQQIILNKENMTDYSDLPDFVIEKYKSGTMRPAHFSDLLRLNLLKNHGGIWMDATNYMTAEIPKQIQDSEFFFFHTDHLTNYSYSFIQNFFIRAKPASFLLNAWYELCIEFWKENDTEFEYFIHQLLFRALVENNARAAAEYAKIPKISEDQALQFVGKKLFAKFDAAKWYEIKQKSFFQKLTYKDRRRHTAIASDYPGSYFEKFSAGEI